MKRHRKAPGDAPTIFDVAKMSGVSIKTVSRVINKEPNVRQGTRQKVMQAVTKLNYQPNAAARGLSGKRSFVIGLVYENPNEFSYLGQVLSSALSACEQQGYSLLLKPLALPSATLAEDVKRFALQARVDGMLLLPPVCDLKEATATLESLQLPLVAISPKSPQPSSVSVHCEEQAACYQLTEHVIQQGHKRIGFIKGPPDHGASAMRYAGYKAALQAHGLPLDSSLVKPGQFDFASGQKATAKLLDLTPPPTAIVASNDDMAAGTYFEAQQRGLKIPDDLSVTGYDDTPLASHIWPPLTTVKQPIDTMAKEAVQSLLAMVSGEPLSQASMTFGCKLVIRHSVARPA